MLPSTLGHVRTSLLQPSSKAVQASRLFLRDDPQFHASIAAGEVYTLQTNNLAAQALPGLQDSLTQIYDLRHLSHNALGAEFMGWSLGEKC